MNHEATTLVIRNAYITLAHAVKAVGLSESGGQAKVLVREGGVRVNGETVTQPGRKLFPGDRFQVGDTAEWRISASNETE